MANVGFKLGTQESLDILLKNGGATEGSFYLTSDTNRLYIGKSNGAIAPVNEGVISVENVDALIGVTATPGAFYYAKQENVLCVYSNDTWIQINAIVTNSNVGYETSNAVGEDNNPLENTITLTTNIYDSRGGDPATGSFNITGSDGITITGENSTVTVKGDPITVSTSLENNSVLTTTFKSASGATDGTFELTAGDNIEFEESNGTIAIKASDTYAKAIAIKNSVGTDATGFDVEIGLSDGSIVSDPTHFDPVIVLKAEENSQETSIKFKGGSATLPVYTATEVNTIKTDLQNEINNKIRNFNAMVYRGTVGTSGILEALPATNIQIGDAYLVSGTYQQYPSGTLIVATGTEQEGSDYIEDGKVTWTYITGSTADTTYFGKINTDGSLGIYSSTDSLGEPVASINVIAGNTMEIEASGKENSTSDRIYTVNHKTFEGESYNIATEGTITSNEADSSFEEQNKYTIEAITGIDVENGHITSVSSTKYPIPKLDINSKIEISENSNVATVNLTNNLYNKNTGIEAENDKVVSFTIESENLSITSEENTSNIAINLTWGEF